MNFDGMSIEQIYEYLAVQRKLIDTQIEYIETLKQLTNRNRSIYELFCLASSVGKGLITLDVFNERLLSFIRKELHNAS